SFFFQAEDGIRDRNVTGVQTCALPILYKLKIHVSVPPLFLLLRFRRTGTIVFFHQFLVFCDVVDTCHNKCDDRNRKFRDCQFHKFYLVSKRRQCRLYKDTAGTSNEEYLEEEPCNIFHTACHSFDSFPMCLIRLMSVALDGTFCHRKKYRTDKSGNTAESYVKRTKESSEDTIRAYEPSGRSAFYFSHQIRSRFTQTVRLQYTCYK